MPFFQTIPWTEETLVQLQRVGWCPQYPGDNAFRGTSLTATAFTAQPSSLSCAYGSKQHTTTAGDQQSKAGGAEKHTLALQVLEGAGEGV